MHRVIKHLTESQIQELAEQGARAADNEHLASCETCRARLDRELKLDYALFALPRIEPPTDLAARVQAALSARLPGPTPVRRSTWTGIASGLAASTVVILLYQTGIALQANGALDFISFFAEQPEVVTMYPGEALSALLESLPLLDIAITLVVLAIALGLLRQFVVALAFTQPSRFKA